MHSIYFIAAAVLVIVYMLISIRKDKLSVSLSFKWVLFCITLLFLSANPTSLDWVANYVGIHYPPALFLTVAAVILFVMSFNDSKKIEILQKKLTHLAQEVSILKAEREKASASAKSPATPGQEK